MPLSFPAVFLLPLARFSITRWLLVGSESFCFFFFPEFLWKDESLELLSPLLILT